MDVHFGVTFAPGPLGEFTGWAKLADELGYEILGIGDSQSLYRELYVGCTLAALNTKRIKLGPRVTNPLTRHPAVAASAIASINEVSGGRALLGLGTGDSAVLNLGLRPAKMVQLEEYIVAIKTLFKRGETTYQGRTIRLTWAKNPVPIYIAAEGPKMLRLAGRLADGIVVGTGLTPELVKDAINYVREGAQEAGRKLEDIDLWWIVKGNLGEDREAAVREIRMALAASAHHAFRFSLDGKRVPPELVERIETLKREYQTQEHERLGAGKHNADVVDRLGLRDFLAERFAVVGTPRDCIKKIESLVEAGANKLWISVIVNDRPAYMRAMAERVIPAFR